MDNKTFDGMSLRSHILGGSVLFVLVLLGSIALLFFWIVRDITEDLEATLLQKTEIWAYQLVSTVEEIVLTADAQDLSILSQNSWDLEKDIRAIYQNNPTYLYCVVQDAAYRIIFRDSVQCIPPQVYLPVSEAITERSDPIVQKLEVQVDGETQAFYQFTVPIAIYDRHRGILRLGISKQEVSEQISRIMGILVQKNLIGSILMTGLVALAAFQMVHLIRRARRVEAQIQYTDRLIFLGTLASGLAHELRNPLNAIHVNSEVLAEEAGQSHVSHPEIIRLTREIGDAVRYLDATLSSFLRFARPTRLMRESVDLRRLISETIRFVEGQCEQKNIRIVWNEPGPLPAVWADETQLKQALLNLLLNAQQAMPEGGVLSVCASTTDTTTGIEVTDTGPGIPEADQEKIFNLFYSTRQGGSGLGLPIARRIVEEHGGRLEVRSPPGGGASFLIWLKTAQTSLSGKTDGHQR